MKNYEKPNLYVVNLNGLIDILTVSSGAEPLNYDNDASDINWGIVKIEK